MRDIADTQLKAADIIKADNLPAQPVSTSFSNSTRISTNSSIGASSTGFYMNSLASCSSSTSGKMATNASSFGEVTISTTPLRPPPTPSSLSFTVSATATSLAQTALTISASESVPHSRETITTSLASSTPETVVAITKTLPSTLPPLLSSLDHTHFSEPLTALPGPTPHHHHSSPWQSLRPHEHLSSSVVGVLTSAGVPSPHAASLVPVIIGGPSEPDAAATAASQMGQQEVQAAIDAFIQWLLNFFRSD